MTSSQLFLILISGLGVLHGLFFAVFLWVYPKGKSISNKILSVLLLMLSFRVGKSVLMEFAVDTDATLVLVGLSALMIIGPLFYLFTCSLIDTNFQLKISDALHFLMALVGVVFGVWAEEPWLKEQSDFFFILLFALYYGHYFAYLLISYAKIKRGKGIKLPVKEYAFLSLLFYALLAIWVVYVLNLFEEAIPYILGPILYSVIAYSVSFIILKKGYLQSSKAPAKYKTTTVSEDQIDRLFGHVVLLMEQEQLFTNSTLTLKSLSLQLKVSTQVLSMAINKKAEQNFNGFINQYRIEAAKKSFENPLLDHQTISSIAFEVGFNSISSFNTAFKKITGKTPLAYRKGLSK